MLKIESRLPTANLPIKKILSKLFQAYVYHYLDPKEHDGYRHKSGKLFKTTNFKIVYENYLLTIHLTSMNPETEQKIALAILKNGLMLGGIKLIDTTVKIENRHIDQNQITVKGFVSAAIKDGNTNKKIYLELKTTKFIEIITNNTLQKYETLLHNPYEEELKIELLHQNRDGRIFYYNKGTIKVWHATYKISAEPEMLNLVLDTGLGANSMKGLGFVEVV